MNKRGRRCRKDHGKSPGSHAIAVIARDRNSQTWTPINIAWQSRNQNKISEAIPAGSYDVSFPTYNNEPGRQESDESS
jgi:hypothetical protein